MTTIRDFFGRSIAEIENDCINGTFDIWQRGTSTTVNGLISDRFYENSITGTIWTVSRQDFDDDQIDVSGSPNYFHRYTITDYGDNTKYNRTQVKIFDVKKYAGKKVAVVFWAKADSIKNIALSGAQYGLSSGSVDSISSQKFGISTSWTKYVKFIEFPNISSGTTVASMSSSMFSFWYSAGSNFNSNSDTLGLQTGTFDIAEVQIYISDIERNVRRRTAQEEFDLCLPYYWQPDTTYAWSGATRNAQLYDFSCSFPTPMIQIPAITTEHIYADDFDSSNPVVSGITINGFKVRKIANNTDHGRYHFKFTADAEF